MDAKLKPILIWIATVCCLLSFISLANAKTTTPKLLGIQTVEFQESADEILAVSIPYTDLAPVHQKIVLKYKPLVLQAIAKDSHSIVADYHVKRAAMDEEAPPGYMVIYYETIYNKKICEISAVTVNRKGDYSIKTSLC